MQKKGAVREFIKWATLYLDKKGVDNSRVEAELIAEKIKGKRRIHFYLEQNLCFNEKEAALFKKEIKRRGRRVPLAYITGEQYFMEYRFVVVPGVYIPRPETEILVEEACRIFEAKRNPLSPLKIIDIGTGTGNIAISIAKRLKNCHIYAVDISDRALKIAKINAQLTDTSHQIEFFLGDLFPPQKEENLKGKIDLIVSNPPYVDTNKIKTLLPEVRKEPIFAIDGGEDGLSFYKRIIPQSYLWLKKGGWLALEIGYDQADKVAGIVKENKQYFCAPCLIYDLDNNPRVITVQRK